MQFGKNKFKALLDFVSEVNSMTLTYITKLGFISQTTTVSAYRIDGLALKTNKMVTTGFSVYDKIGSAWFFGKTFLLADINMKVALRMFFLSLSNIKLLFGARKFIWRTYTIVKTMPIARKVKLIDGHEFTKAVFDETSETFAMHVVAWKTLSKMTIYLSGAAQVSRLEEAAKLTTLQWNRTFTKIPTKYIDYTDVFLPDLIMELPKNTDMNEYALKLIESKQLFYRPIYTLGLVALKILKTYIKIHLKIGFM